MDRQLSKSQRQKYGVILKFNESETAIELPKKGDTTFLEFSKIIQALTGVPMEKQIIWVNGKMLYNNWLMSEEGKRYTTAHQIHSKAMTSGKMKSANVGIRPNDVVMNLNSQKLELTLCEEYMN